MSFATTAHWLGRIPVVLGSRLRAGGASCPALPSTAGTAPARGAQRSHAVTIAIAVVACALSASASTAQTIVPVSTASQLRSAVTALTSNTTIVLAPGTYTLDATLTVTGPLTDVTIRGATGNRDDVVIVGPGMQLAADTLHGIETVGAVTRLTVSDLSIREFPGSSVFIGAGASSPRVRNVHLTNAGRTFVDTAATFTGADAGIVEYSLIEYVAPALAKINNTGGVRIRGGANWVVRRNTFRRIWFGGQTGLSFAAILADTGSSGTLAESNTIVDCQRGISFGLIDQVGTYDHLQGIIRNNVIYRSGSLEPLGIGGDVGIHVADATGTRVTQNTILQLDGYPFAIEYRYPATTGVTIKNNLVDKIILQREGAVATLTSNYTSATAAMFVNAAGEDLHLAPTAAAAINAGAATDSDGLDGFQDFDGQQRPLTGTLPDIGADEFGGVGPTVTTTSPLPAATVGVSYKVALAASGGAAPITWSGPVAGVLPPGLLFTGGAVAGVPTASGTYTFRVRGTASDLAFGEKTFSLAVSTPPQTLTVTKTGTGSGTVTSNPAGINCGAVCAAQFVPGTVVTLTATPAAGSTFEGWSGDADCSDGTVTLTAARLCQATFNALLTPAITRVAPVEGPLAGGTVITITGANFPAGTMVTVGGVPAPGIVVTNATTIRAVTPPTGAAGSRVVAVTTPGGTAGLVNGFTYVAETTDDVLDGKTLPSGSDFLQPALSADGRYLAYVVTSDAAIPGDSNGVADVVVRDRVTGTVTRMSVATDGTPANGRSGRPRISADGRYVAFWSEASNLVAGDSNGVRDVFLHDRDADGNNTYDETAAGAQTTIRVSVDSDGRQGDAASALDGERLIAAVASDGQLDLSPDGLWVAFTSQARTLVPDDTNGVADIFLYSVREHRTTRVSVAADGTQADGPSQSPAVSKGALRIVFASSATNLLPGQADTNGLRDIYLVVRSSGQVVRLSETAARGNADGPSDAPSIDDAGRAVAFATRARNLVPALASSTTAQIVVATLPRDTTPAGASAVSDAPARAAEVIDVTEILKQLASGALPPGAGAVQPGDGASSQPEMCGNGTCVGYSTNATNLTPESDTNGVPDVVRQPVVTEPPAAPPPVQRLSTDVEGNQATEPSTGIAMSEDGGVVAMESQASLTPASRNNSEGTNVFVRAVPMVVATLFPIAAEVEQSAPVVLTGTGFQAGAVVLFGGVARDAAVSPDGRTLRTTTPTAPAVAPGAVPVTVRNPDGSTVPLFQQFTFLAPPQDVPSPDTDADGLPDAWEVSMGLDPQSAAGANGASGDPDDDGRTNAEEFAAGTHPRGFYTRYFAEGSQSVFFDTRFALLNPAPTAARALVRFLRPRDAAVPFPVTVGAHARATVTPGTIAGVSTSDFSVVLESDLPLVADRQMTWAYGLAYGSHGETSVARPATKWYFAEGATHPGFELFYLIQNPTAETATVDVEYLLTSGAPVLKQYTSPPNSRLTIWANLEPELKSGKDVSATFTSSAPIIMERAMYFGGRVERPFSVGHASAGVTEPATEWFLAEGATGAYFDDFVLVANPNPTPAEVSFRFLQPNGNVVTRAVTVAGKARLTMLVDLIPELAATDVSTIVTADLPILVERAMYWPGGASTWYEGHNSFGVTSTGLRWGLAEGEAGGPNETQTFVLIANTSPFDGQARVTVYGEDGATFVKTYPVFANSRRTIGIGLDEAMGGFGPQVQGRRFGCVVESLPAVDGGESPQLVVERAMYSNSEGVYWAAGHNSVATKLP